MQHHDLSSKVRLRVKAACIVVCAAVAAGPAQHSYAQTQSPVAVRAAYIPVVTWLPAWVAKEKGFFKAHGLDVTLSVAQNLSILPGTVGKQFEIVPSTAPDLLKSVASGLDVVAVASEVFETEDNPSTHVIVAKDSGIAGPKDLVGKLIATPTIGGVIHVSVLYWLKKNGVDPTSVRAVEVPFPNMPDQLKAKRVDAVESVEPFAGALRANGNVSIADPLLSVGKDVLFPFWISQGEWARANLPTIEAWIAALEDAKSFIEKNPEEARKIMAQYTKLPEAVVQATPFPTYRFAIKAEDIQVWAAALKDVDQLDKEVDSSKLVVTP
ncbi:MAG: ABC transporter substrate-binding protein [Bradyrhizobium sp.]|uniref:ABC transporter substrate-binding protein n=1 Tax=Bradyrhizobium sp. TaxID=376 RepID=UPI001D2D6B21|nr:ABC transporter substrate-binding protein [Bradyrhizobium sp.]MBV9566489.1 ABC transporter substrate-binding protein [Bradyrhizobium sp.]